MTKKELIYSISFEAGLSSAEAAKAVDAFLKVVTKTLQKGEPVSLLGFGSFFPSQTVTLRKKKSSPHRLEGEIETIPRFKASLKLKNAMKKKNKPGREKEEKKS